MQVVARFLSLTLLVLPSFAAASEDCRSTYLQRELEDLLIEAFETLPDAENNRSSHCVFQIDMPGMDVPAAGAELGHCRWQGVDGETEFHLDPEHPDQVAVIHGDEEVLTVNLCDV